jgi:hypothetical protein
MKLPRGYKLAGICIKFSVIIWLTYIFVVSQISMTITVMVVLLLLAFLQYGLGHLVQNGRRWTRYPVLISSVFSLMFVLVEIPAHYDNLVWMVLAVSMQGLSMTAAFLVFNVKPTEEKGNKAWDIDLSDDAILDQE